MSNEKIPLYLTSKEDYTKEKKKAIKNYVASLDLQNFILTFEKVFDNPNIKSVKIHIEQANMISYMDLYELGFDKKYYNKHKLKTSQYQGSSWYWLVLETSTPLTKEETADILKIEKEMRGAVAGTDVRSGQLKELIADNIMQNIAMEIKSKDDLWLMFMPKDLREKRLRLIQYDKLIEDYSEKEAFSNKKAKIVL